MFLEGIQQTDEDPFCNTCPRSDFPVGARVSEGPRTPGRLQTLSSVRAGSDLRVESPLFFIVPKGRTGSQLPENKELHWKHTFKGNFQTDGIKHNSWSLSGHHHALLIAPVPCF